MAMSPSLLPMEINISLAGKTVKSRCPFAEQRLSQQ